MDDGELSDDGVELIDYTAHILHEGEGEDIKLAPSPQLAAVTAKAAD